MHLCSQSTDIFGPRWSGSILSNYLWSRWLRRCVRCAVKTCVREANAVAFVGVSEAEESGLEHDVFVFPQLMLWPSLQIRAST